MTNSQLKEQITAAYHELFAPLFMTFGVLMNEDNEDLKTEIENRLSNSVHFAARRIEELCRDLDEHEIDRASEQFHAAIKSESVFAAIPYDPWN